MSKEIKIDKILLTDFLKIHTVSDAAKHFNVHNTAIYRKIKKYNISEYMSNRLGTKFDHILTDKDKCLDLMQNHTKTEIAEMFSTSIGTITKKFETLGISKSNECRPTPLKLKDKYWILNSIKTKSLTEIAEELDTSSSVVYYACKKFNIHIKNKNLVSDDRYFNYDFMYEKTRILSCLEIGRIFNVSASAVWAQCKKLGILDIPNLRDISDTSTEYLSNMNNLYTDYIVNEMTIEKIAENMDCSSTSVSEYLKKHSIDVRKEEVPAELLDKQWVENRLKNYTIPIEIAEELDISFTTVYKYLKIHGLEKVTHHRTSVPLKSRKLLNNKKWLEENYKMYTIKELAKSLGVSSTPVREALNKFDIETNIHRQQSAGERDVISRFPNHNIIENIQTLIPNSKLEIDIYFPDRKFGVEYDGAYWHSKKDKLYHQKKKQEFADNGIDIMQIWDYEWANPVKQEIIISMINNKVSKPKNILRASKCTVSPYISVSQSRSFLEENHIQGYTNGSIRYGLLHNNQIVALMTFAKPRFSKKYDYEMIRFAVKKDHRVHGAASKIFKQFQRDYSSSVVSYCDLRYGTGGMYDALGFTLVNKAAPNYRWVDKATGTISYPRYKAQKHKLHKLLGADFDPNGTEKSNMEDAGFMQIFDSGNLVYSYTP